MHPGDIVGDAALWRLFWGTRDEELALAQQRKKLCEAYVGMRDQVASGGVAHKIH